MRKDTARVILDMADHHTRKLIALLRVVEENCTELERQAYIRGLGQVLGNMYDVLEYIYREHPEMEPEELKRKPHG